MCSGVGPGRVLKDAGVGEGVGVVLESGEVGRNLSDVSRSVLLHKYTCRSFALLLLLSLDSQLSYLVAGCCDRTR